VRAVARCCDPGPYAKVFGAKTARRDARDYRTKGLDATAGRLANAAGSTGLEGATVLEIGGGIGAIAIELLRGGAARATNIELSPEYEEPMRELLRDFGLEGRMDLRLGDVARDAALAPDADIVVMHRVVCCYPDMPALVSVAAAKARRLLALSYPRQSWWTWLGFGILGIVLPLFTGGFRPYLHRPTDIASVARAQGMTGRDSGRGWIWETLVLERRVAA
jgi:hypothetical protein